MALPKDIANIGSIANAMYNSITANTTAITSISVSSANSANLTTTTNVATIGTAAYFVANGNVGIGTSSPTARLDVSGTAALTGNSSAVGLRLLNAAETVNVSATAATGTVTFRVSDQAVLYYTSNATANWTPNVSFSSGTTLNTAMTNGQSISVAFLVTQGATAYYSNTISIDGSAVTPKWQGGTTPTAGNASGIDSYVYNIIKTGTSTYTVLASLTQFK
jgi:hypothetical protein